MEGGFNNEQPVYDNSKNDIFPIHVNFNDDAADMRTSKPGGYFCKKLYSENNESEDEADARGATSPPVVQVDSDDDDPELNGGRDAAYNGFCRTDRHHRLHYKIARFRDQKKQEALEKESEAKLQEVKSVQPKQLIPSRYQSKQTLDDEQHLDNHIQALDVTQSSFQTADIKDKDINSVIKGQVMSE